MNDTIKSKPVPLWNLRCLLIIVRSAVGETDEKLATEQDTANNQCCISLSKMDKAEAGYGSDRSTATRVVLRSCIRSFI